MQNSVTKLKRVFLENEIAFLSIFAAFGRAGVYSPSAREDKKRGLRQFIRKKLKTYQDKYRDGNMSDDDERHISNIQQLAQDISKSDYKDILRGGRLRIGVAQKLLNLYLKYSWALGWIRTPPHCPFDSRIITKLGKDIPTECRSFTRAELIDCYLKWIEAARRHTTNHEEKIAEWELKTFESLRF